MKGRCLGVDCLLKLFSSISVHNSSDNVVLCLHIVDHSLQNRLLAMNYINEGHDDKLFEAHRFQLHNLCSACVHKIFFLLKFLVTLSTYY